MKRTCEHLKGRETKRGRTEEAIHRVLSSVLDLFGGSSRFAGSGLSVEHPLCRIWVTPYWPGKKGESAVRLRERGQELVELRVRLDPVRSPTNLSLTEEALAIEEVATRVEEGLNDAVVIDRDTPTLKRITWLFRTK